MKKFQWPIRAFLFVGLLQIVSCTKTSDVVSKDSVSVETSNNLTFPVTNEFADCKIRNIIHEHAGIGGLVTGLFTYSKGNPVSLTYRSNNCGNCTGNPEHFFYYDKQGRLKEWRVTYFPELGEQFAESRHLYGYDANNLITTDTLVHFPGDENEIIYISALTYDSQSRIIKETIRNVKNGADPLKPTRNPTYTYDARGNLAVAGWKSSSYDNKVSLFRSHPVFQFIFRNYSKNNAAPEAKYNSKGLPSSVRNLNDIFFNCQPGTDAFDRTGITRIMYDCL